MHPDQLLLTNRVALVTGAAQGIGKATALALADLGARVAVCDKLGEGLVETTAELESKGGTGQPIPVSEVIDVRDAAAVEGWISRAAEELGPIDILVNNAGGGFWSPFSEVSVNAETALVRENFGTVTNCIRSVLPRLNNGASIVNVTSVEAYHSAPGFAVYAAMKAAVQQFTQSMAVELGPLGVRVNCVAPDMIPTPGDESLAGDSDAMMDGFHPTPLQRMGSVEECAAVICFLASDLASFVNGSTIPVDGGTVAAGTWKIASDGAWKM